MKNKTARIVLIVLAAIAAHFIFLVIAFAPITTFQWHGNLSSEDRASLAEQALMPRIADYVERYGTRGFQDVDLQIETVKFSSMEEMAEKLDLGKAIDDLNVTKGSDKNGKNDATYELGTVSVSDGNQSKVMADTSLISTYSDERNWTWHYSIHQYKDGSCRFIVLISP
ncbi:MAG: hypothetical protein J6U36_06000 [Oscillospiraceae bacterium]|nr:hypothetical protein [Oscillospiraceae bacterium]